MKRDQNVHVMLCLAPLINSRPLTPNTAVEFVSQHVEEYHHRHVKKEEAHQTSCAEVGKEGVHPDPNGQVHPHNPAECVQKETNKQSHCICHLVLSFLKELFTSTQFLPVDNEDIDCEILTAEHTQSNKECSPQRLDSCMVCAIRDTRRQRCSI